MVIGLLIFSMTLLCTAKLDFATLILPLMLVNVSFINQNDLTVKIKTFIIMSIYLHRFDSLYVYVSHSVMFYSLQPHGL